MTRRGAAWWIPAVLGLIVFTGTAATAGTADIQAAADAAGHCWVAGPTSISVLPPHEQVRRLGLDRPDWMGWADTGEVRLPVITPPARLDYTPYVTPVRNQGSCGSCWAFATTGALESYNLRHDKKPNTNDDRAEEILLSCSGAGSCDGGYTDGASEFIRATGLPPELDFPYTSTPSDDQCGNAKAGWQQETRRINRWTYVTRSLPDVNTIKTALTLYGPVVTAMEVYSDFYSYRSGIYEYATGTIQGGHAILIVGYQDDKTVHGGGYFLVKNSWGTGWGEAGFFRIAYSQLLSPVGFGQWTLAYTDTYTLTVHSDNPVSGVSILTTPTDEDNQGEGATPFTRTYAPQTAVTLTAAGAANGYAFQKWDQDGTDLSIRRSVTVKLGADHTLKAVYGNVKAHTLTVQADGASKVALVVSPTDLGGVRTGTAPMTGTYAEGQKVIVKAPETVGKSLLVKWTVDGQDAGEGVSLTVTMAADHTVVGVYQPAPPLRITARLPQYNRPPATYRFSTVYSLEAKERATKAPDWQVDGIAAGAAGSLTYTFQQAGSHTVNANTTTNQGRTLEGSLQVTVNENQLPVGTLDCSGSSIIRAKTGTLYGLRCKTKNLKDPDGHVRSMVWKIPSEGYVSDNVTMLRYTFDAPKAVQVECDVTDDSGGIATLKTTFDLSTLKQ